MACCEFSRSAGVYPVAAAPPHTQGTDHIPAVDQNCRVEEPLPHPHVGLRPRAQADAGLASQRWPAALRPSKLILMQQDPGQWVAHAWALHAHTLLMMHWPVNPFAHLGADLADILSSDSQRQSSCVWKFRTSSLCSLG